MTFKFEPDKELERLMIHQTHQENPMVQVTIELNTPGIQDTQQLTIIILDDAS